MTLPEHPGVSFAFIYSVEDPGTPPNPAPFFPTPTPTPVHHRTATCAQVMGPDDGYLVQWSPAVDTFWGARHALELGATFTSQSYHDKPPVVGPVTPEAWRRTVREGFQALPRRHLGRLRATEAPGTGLPSTVDTCAWDITVDPVYGWGTPGDTQKSTAGWLAALPVFEPHWQVVQAHGWASGTVQWGDKEYTFDRAPLYAEKNWGGQFPQKWFWVQCNSFRSRDSPAGAGDPPASAGAGNNDDDGDGDGFAAGSSRMTTTSVTAGGGRRELLGGIATEDVAMIGVHHQGQYYAIYPWEDDAVVTWKVSPWGSWDIRGMTPDMEIRVVGRCPPDAGTPLRAPTVDRGMVPFCKDTFRGDVEVTVVIEKGKKGTSGGNGSGSGSGSGTVVVDVVSYAESGALEVGGGPWWETWEGRAEMREPLRSVVRAPLEEALAPWTKMAPSIAKPPGL